MLDDAALDQIEGSLKVDAEIHDTSIVFRGRLDAFRQLRREHAEREAEIKRLKAENHRLESLAEYTRTCWVAAVADQGMKDWGVSYSDSRIVASRMANERLSEWRQAFDECQELTAEIDQHGIGSEYDAG